MDIPTVPEFFLRDGKNDLSLSPSEMTPISIISVEMFPFLL